PRHNLRLWPTRIPGRLNGAGWQWVQSCPSLPVPGRLSTEPSLSGVGECPSRSGAEGALDSDGEVSAQLTGQGANANANHAGQATPGTPDVNRTGKPRPRPEPTAKKQSIVNAPYEIRSSGVPATSIRDTVDRIIAG